MENIWTSRNDPPEPILTVGHSTRPLDDFVEILKLHGVTRVIDVRAIPRSRLNLQFNKDTLLTVLGAQGIGYLHMAGLGGLRHSRRDSANQGWLNTAFMAFADYMQSPEFQENIEALIRLSEMDRLALMCAEAVPWRCHRSLIADALTIREIPVEHIVGPGSRRPHVLTAFASVSGYRITYPLQALANEPAQLARV